MSVTASHGLSHEHVSAQPPYAPVSTPTRPWSFTTSVEPREANDMMIVCSLPMSALGIDDFADEVAERSGDEEGRRWQHARAEEYATGLVNALHLHLSAAELIVHVEEANTKERVQVLFPARLEPSEVALREAEVADRVRAIRTRTWLTWFENLRRTVDSLRELEALS
ncbi:MAG: hypothetical protein AB7V27_18970 [Candidatus Binatia bacterium]